MRPRIPKLILGVMSLSLTAILMSGCQESLEDRALREAEEFTQKSCPTPAQDNVITDSMTFDKSSHTFYYYFTLTGAADDSARIADRGDTMHEVLVDAVRYNTSLKRYKDAGYGFRYTYYSERDRGKLLYETTVRPEEYQ